MSRKDKGITKKGKQSSKSKKHKDAVKKADKEFRKMAKELPPRDKVPVDTLLNEAMRLP